MSTPLVWLPPPDGIISVFDRRATPLRYRLIANSGDLTLHGGEALDDPAHLAHARTGHSLEASEYRDHVTAVSASVADASYLAIEGNVSGIPLCLNWDLSVRPGRRRRRGPRPVMMWFSSDSGGRAERCDRNRRKHSNKRPHIQLSSRSRTGNRATPAVLCEAKGSRPLYTIGAGSDRSLLLAAFILARPSPWTDRLRGPAWSWAACSASRSSCPARNVECSLRSSLAAWRRHSWCRRHFRRALIPLRCRGHLCFRLARKQSRYC